MTLLLVLSAFAADADAIFARYNKVDSPGCSVAVVRAGKIDFARGYGMADLDHDIALSPRSVFHVASLSKQFTAMSVVLLAADGKLSLDDPVRKHLPAVPDFGITLRHLLHHSSGLRDQWSLLNLAGWRLSEDVVRDEDVMDLVGRMRELNFKPGERYLYSNTGYTLLAQVVRRVSGQTLREFTRARIFEPLGMNDTHFRDDHQETVKGMAYGYTPSPGGFRQSIPHYDTVGASSLLTTVEDLAKWDATFDRFGAKLLEKTRLTSGAEIPYRFGLLDDKWRGTRSIEHAGADAGYRAHYLRLPEHALSVICLCNTTANPSQLVREVAAKWLDGKLAPEPAKPSAVAVPESDLKRWTGMYWSDAEQDVRSVELDRGQLFVRVRMSREPLTPIGAARFLAEGPRVEYEFGDTMRERFPDRTVEFRRFEPAPAKAADFAASYYSSEIDSTFRVEAKAGALFAHRKKQLTYSLEPAVADTFTSTLGTMRFERDATGRVTAFRLSNGRVLGLRFVRR